MAPKMLALGAPWRPGEAKAAQETTKKRTLEKDSKKDQKRAQKKPVLAREREARFILGL